MCTADCEWLKWKGQWWQVRGHAVSFPFYFIIVGHEFSDDSLAGVLMCGIELHETVPDDEVEAKSNDLDGIPL